MAITIKTDEEIDLMRQSGQLLAKVHEELHAAVRPGISTLELDEIGEKTIRALGGIPNWSRILLRNHSRHDSCRKAGESAQSADFNHLVN